MTYRTDQVEHARDGESGHSLWKVSLGLGLTALISILALIAQGPHLAA